MDEVKREESIGGNNGKARVPTYATWPPAWLTIPAPSDMPASVELIRFEPANDTAPCMLDYWIPRTGADGREGFDLPGQPVADRWWERVSFEDLPQ